jgi:hypothetical protein
MSLEFFAANQARLSLKMQLIDFCWFKETFLSQSQEGYCIVVKVSDINHQVTRHVPTIWKSTYVKLES